MIKTGVKRWKHYMYLKETTCHKCLFMHFRTVTSGQYIRMSFGSEAAVTRFNRRKQRVKTSTWHVIGLVYVNWGATWGKPKFWGHAP